MAVSNQKAQENGILDALNAQDEVASMEEDEEMMGQLEEIGHKQRQERGVVSTRLDGNNNPVGAAANNAAAAQVAPPKANDDAGGFEGLLEDSMAMGGDIVQGAE